MQNIILVLLSFLMWLTTVAMVFLVSSLIFWGIGAFILTVFQINYEWTFLHGFASTLIFLILSSIFTSK